MPVLENFRRHAGFTLLEALIALVVFSVALLGLAGMYTKTLSISHSSYLRTLASIQANDLEERIRANPGATRGAVTAGLATDDAYHFSCDVKDADGNTIDNGFTSNSALGFSQAKTPDELADWDQGSWCASVGRVFGGLINSASVEARSAEGGGNVPQVTYTITLEWSERQLDTENKQAISLNDFTYTVRR